MKKSLVVISALASFVVLSCAVTNSVTANPEFKNLKLLPKDITRVQLDSVMKSFTVALNVKCNFCHVRTADGKEFDFPSDAHKHKLVARDMIKLTNEINKEYFDLTGAKQNITTPLMVTCYTCHNGKKEPLTMPAAQETR